MTTAVIERQWPLDSSPLKFTFQNDGAGNGFSIAIPPGAIVKSVTALVTTVFNAGTTNTMTASDGTTTFINAATTGALGSLTSTNSPKFYPSGGTITFTGAQTGTAATAGVAYCWISYLVVGRATEVETN